MTTSGKLLRNYGKSPSQMGRRNTISGYFHYVQLPEVVAHMVTKQGLISRGAQPET